MIPMTRRHLLALGAAMSVAGVARAQEADPRLVEMSLGNADAPVTIIEYASFTCPHCATFHRDVLPLIKTEFIETGKVRLVFREVFFDRFGLWATMVARCGGQMRYFGMVDEIYRTQRDWTVGEGDAAVAENLRKIGRLAALTDDQINACLGDQTYANALVQGYQANAERDGIDSTPSFMINGEKFGNMGFDAFKAEIEARLG